MRACAGRLPQGEGRAAKCDGAWRAKRARNRDACRFADASHEIGRAHEAAASGAGRVRRAQRTGASNTYVVERGRAEEEEVAHVVADASARFQDVKRRKMRDKDVLVDRMYDVLERAAVEELAMDRSKRSSGTIPTHVTSDPWTKHLGTRSPNNRRKVQPKKRRMEHEQETRTWEDEVLLQIAAPLSQRINQVAETRPAPAIQAWEGPPIDVDELLATFESDPKLTHALERMANTTVMPIDGQGTMHVGSPQSPSMWNANQDTEDPAHLHTPNATQDREKHKEGSLTYQDEDGTNGRDGRKKGTRKSLLEELEESEVEALLSGLHYT